MGKFDSHVHLFAIVSFRKEIENKEREREKRITSVTGRASLIFLTTCAAESDCDFCNRELDRNVTAADKETKRAICRERERDVGLRDGRCRCQRSRRSMRDAICGRGSSRESGVCSRWVKERDDTERE